MISKQPLLTLNTQQALGIVIILVAMIRMGTAFNHFDRPTRVVGLWHDARHSLERNAKTHGTIC